MEPIVEISARGMALVPVVIGLTQVTKMYVGSYGAPLFALVFGIGGSLLVGGVEFLGSTWAGGVVVGLMASGLYSGTRAMWDK